MSPIKFHEGFFRDKQNQETKFHFIIFVCWDFMLTCEARVHTSQPALSASSTRVADDWKQREEYFIV